MSLDADVAAVMDGSRTKVRGILRLPARPPPSYSAIAARQTQTSTRSTPPGTRLSSPLPSPAHALVTQAWQTVTIRKRTDTPEAKEARQQQAVDASEVADSEAIDEDSKADRSRDAGRRRKKKAGEPPPPSLQFAELLDAQLRRAQQKQLAAATDTAATQHDNNIPQHPLITHTVDPPTSAASGVTSVVAAGKRAKPTRLKRQMREQQLQSFIRQRILAPIVRAAVRQAHHSGVSESVSDGGEESEESRREVERREKKRMLRHLKRKQKRIDKHSHTNNNLPQPTHAVTTAEADEETAEEKEETDDAEDLTAAPAAESLVPLSQPVDADEDPTCPSHPYTFTADERAFLFQHVVVDRYHAQPPLSPLLSALCQQLFTPAVDTPVAHLLLALASYQRRALASPSPLVRARGRRYVSGLREALKRLRQNKLTLLVLPHNIDTSTPAITTQLTSLYHHCITQHVTVVWSLSRRRLATCAGVKGRVAVVGVVSGEGCSELMKAVRERAKEAREAWLMRGWDERVEAGVRERRLREEADREAVRREWVEREAEAKREAQRKERARLEKEMEEARKRDAVQRAKQAEQRIEQQRQAALRRQVDEQKEQQRIVEEAEKVKRKVRAEKTSGSKGGKGKVSSSAQQQQMAGSGIGSGGKRTWLEDAVDGKAGGVDEGAGVSGGGGKQERGKGKIGTGKTKRR